jgi:hypothetical protein
LSDDEEPAAWHADAVVQKTAVMKYGLLFANVGPFGEPDGAAELGTICEETGIESVWTVEHVVVPSGYRSAYPYSRDGRTSAMTPWWTAFRACASSSAASTRRSAMPCASASRTTS